MNNKAANIAKAREHYESRASRRGIQKFVKKTNSWKRLKKTQGQRSVED